MQTLVSKLSLTFSFSTCAILAITGLAKLTTAAQTHAYLAAAVPFFPELRWRSLLIIVGISELIICCGIFKQRSARIAPMITLWLCAVLWLFRAGLWLIGYTGPCNCVGYLGDWLRIKRETLDTVILVILIYMTCGSVLVVIFRRKVRIEALGAAILAFGASVGSANEFQMSVSGVERVFVNISGTNVLVQQCTFRVISRDANWMMTTECAQTATRQCNAVVDGVAFTTTTDLADAVTAGAVLGSPTIMLDAMSESEKTLLLAFLLTPGNVGFAGNTNLGVPFLSPRHAALHAYRWSVNRFEEPPFLPKSVRFKLDTQALDHLPEDDLLYHYRGKLGVREAKLELSRFAAAETNAAVFEVIGVTNVGAGTVPIAAEMRHSHYERGQLWARLFEITVTNIADRADADLRPVLRPGSWVQHDIAGTVFMYVATNGQWLTPEDAQRVGMAAKPRKYSSPSPAWLRVGIPTAIRLTILLLILVPPASWLIWHYRGRHK